MIGISASKANQSENRVYCLTNRLRATSESWIVVVFTIGVEDCTVGKDEKADDDDVHYWLLQRHVQCLLENVLTDKL